MADRPLHKERHDTMVTANTINREAKRKMPNQSEEDCQNKKLAANSSVVKDNLHQEQFSATLANQGFRVPYTTGPDMECRESVYDSDNRLIADYKIEMPLQSGGRNLQRKLQGSIVGNDGSMLQRNQQGRPTIPPSIAELKHKLLAPGTNIRMKYACQFFVQSAIHHHGLCDATEDQIKNMSPNRQKLSKDFKDIKQSFALASDSIRQRQYELVTEDYVRAAIQQQNQPAAIDSPLAKRVLYPDTITKEVKLPSPKRNRTNWKAITGKIFPGNKQAQLHIDTFTTLRPMQSQQKKNKNRSPKKTTYYSCDLKICKARLEEDLNNKTCVVKIIMAEHCGCTPRKDISRLERNLEIERLMKSESFLKPTQVANRLLMQLSNEVQFKDNNEALVIKKKLAARVKYINRKDDKKATRNIPRQFQHLKDILDFKEKHMFTLINGEEGPIFRDEKDLRQTSIELFEKDLLKVLPGSQCIDPSKMPETQMTMLHCKEEDYRDQSLPLSDSERRLYERIDILIKEGKDPSNTRKDEQYAYQQSCVFSSIALLNTIRACSKLGWKISVGADGTHRTTNTKWILITFGCVSINKKGKRSLHPFYFNLVPTESELYFSIGLVTFLKYVRCLFGLTDIEFRGLSISDHAHAFSNAFLVAFPKTTLGSCSIHCLRKFWNGGSNGTYKSQFGSQFINKVGSNDVHCLERCLSEEMFHAYADLVYKAWEGEKDLRKTFFRSYVKDPKCNKWFVGVSSLPLCVPENNATEKLNEVMKLNPGSWDVGKNMHTMLREEFPTMIHLFSLYRTGAERHFQIDDDESMLDPRTNNFKAMMDFYKLVDRCTDTHPPLASAKDEVVYVNCMEDEPTILETGRIISRKRLTEYHDALKGKCKYESNDRHKFMQCVDSLCRVTRKEVTVHKSKVIEIRGSCRTFLKQGFCVHSGFIKFQDHLQIACKRVPQSNESRMPRNNQRNQQPKVKQKFEFFNTLEKLTSLQQSVARILYDTELQKNLAPRALKLEWGYVPNLVDWKMTELAEQRQVHWYLKRHTHAKLSIVNHKNTFDGLQDYFESPSEEKESGLLQLIRKIQVDMELIIKGRTDYVLSTSDPTVLSPNALIGSPKQK